MTHQPAKQNPVIPFRELSEIRPAPLSFQALPAPAGMAWLKGKGDRRNIRSREMLAERVLGEFLEMPGLCLTLPQARRLFDIREDICSRVLDGLVAQGRLAQRREGVYGLTRPAL